MHSDIESEEDGKIVHLIGLIIHREEQYYLDMEGRLYPLAAEPDVDLRRLSENQVVLQGIWSLGKVHVQKEPTVLSFPKECEISEIPVEEVKGLVGQLIDNMRMPGSMTKKCHSCDTSIPEESKYCMECGRKQE